MTKQTQKIQFQYRFTREEKEVMAHSLCSRISEAETLEEQKRTSAKDFALRIDVKKAEVGLLCERLKTGEETRELDAVVEFDQPTRGMKSFYHPSTFQFIREEQMQPADMQIELPIEHVDHPQHPAPVPEQTPSDGTIVDAEFEVDKEATREEVDEHAAEGGAITTPVGAILNKAAIESMPPRVRMDLTDVANLEALGSATLIKLFKSNAKTDGWSKLHIDVIANACKGSSVREIIKTLNPHVMPDMRGAFPEAEKAFLKKEDEKKFRTYAELNPEQQRQAMIAVGDEAKENFTYRMDPAAPLAIVECRPI